MLPRCLYLVALLSACTSDDAPGPAAPTNLTATPLGAGAHLTWKDNSPDESEFVIMRMEQGVDVAMVELARVPFNGTSFHDEPLTTGATYAYQIIATNDNGESESNEATFRAP
jgi:hypothetical protein